MRSSRLAAATLAVLGLALLLPLPGLEVAAPAVAPELCPLGRNEFIAIGPWFFHPDPATVLQGDWVHWVNQDDDLHTSTSTANPPVWDSGVLVPGEAFTYRPCFPGAYPYRCNIHGFTGTLVVQG